MWASWGLAIRVWLICCRCSPVLDRDPWAVLLTGSILLNAYAAKFFCLPRDPVAHQRYGLPVRLTYTRLKDATSKPARLAAAALVRPLAYKSDLAVCA